MVVTLIFGSLIYNVHFSDYSQSDIDCNTTTRQLSGRMNKTDMDNSSHRVIQAGIEKYAERVGRKSLDRRRNGSKGSQGEVSTVEFDFAAECSGSRRVPATLRAVREVSVDDSLSRAPNSRGSSIMSLFSSTESCLEEEQAENLPELSPIAKEARPRAA